MYLLLRIDRPIRHVMFNTVFKCSTRMQAIHCKVSK